jgi:hypothetical protein
MTLVGQLCAVTVVLVGRGFLGLACFAGRGEGGPAASLDAAAVLLGCAPGALRKGRTSHAGSAQPDGPTACLTSVCCVCCTLSGLLLVRGLQARCCIGMTTTQGEQHTAQLHHSRSMHPLR